MVEWFVVLQVVLVGHSMGGFANLMLMERFSHKIDFAVFVSAVLAPSGVPFHQDLPLLKLVRSRLSLVASFSNSFCSANKLADFELPSPVLL
jgi:pimeloyl-ACP methyl ester carboxylesterase